MFAPGCSPSLPGDVLNSSGFPGQLKNAFPQRAAARSPSVTPPSPLRRHPVTGHRLAAVHDLPPLARFGGRLATDLRDVTSDPCALDSTGFWAVTADFEGRLVCARFGDVRPDPVPAPVPGAWHGPAADQWTSSLDRGAYVAGVRRIREHIARGEVYQANLCRVLSAPLPDPVRADVDALTALLARGNPAPYAGTIRLPAHGVEIATASPELFLRRSGSTRGVRAHQGNRPYRRGPAPQGPRRERDDRGPGAQRPGPRLRAGLGHRPRAVRRRGTPRPGPPGLHRQRGAGRERRLRPQLLRASFPPGSVTGAPKSSALRIIEALETAPRGPYCGGIGWVDADRGTAELAVGIRTFWIDREVPGGARLRFGTGAGITWGSDPEREWAETELKAARLLAVASGTHETREPHEARDAHGLSEGTVR